MLVPLHWLWRAVDKDGAELDVFFRRHRDTEAAHSLFHRLLGEYDVPEVIHTDRLWSCGAAPFGNFRCLTPWKTCRSSQPSGTTAPLSSPSARYGGGNGNSGGSGHDNGRPNHQSPSPSPLYRSRSPPSLPSTGCL